jgi:hypothetical protein
MEVSGQLQAPAVFTREKPQYPLNMRLGGTQNQCGQKEEKNFLPLPGFEPRTIYHYTDWNPAPNAAEWGLETRWRQEVGQKAAAGASSAAQISREFSMFPRNIFSSIPASFFPLLPSTDVSLYAPICSAGCELLSISQTDYTLYWWASPIQKTQSYRFNGSVDCTARSITHYRPYLMVWTIYVSRIWCQVSLLFSNKWKLI